MYYMAEYHRWLESEAVDDGTKAELDALVGNDEEIKERFYRNLEFGTGGLRGIIGAGTNRMNIYTVRQATQGLASFVLNLGQAAMDKGVAIAYDSRNFSDVFAKEVAAVLAANGVKAYLSDELRPVPVLSFMVRHFGCTAGVIITASHNPAKYNGYKVYGDDGGQVPPESASKVLEFIEACDIFTGVKTANFDTALQSGLIELVSKEIDELYIAQVMKQAVNPEAVQVSGKDMKIIYTPLHGSGNKPVRRALDLAGFKNVLIVKKQEKPDGNLPTVKSPNPEEISAFELAIKMAKKEDVELIIGTDPDCDRVGVVVRGVGGEYIALSGNMVGVLLTEYILAGKKAMGTLPKSGVVIKTIVTSYMADDICAAYGVEVMNVLTGFKFIGEKIKEFECNGNTKEYIFGFEESYGYLAGTYARDKDAVVASMLIAEMAAWYKMRNMTLYDGLMAMYEKYGYYLEKLISVTMEGLDGVSKITGIMSTLRGSSPSEMGGKKVLAKNDYLSGIRTNLESGATSAIDLPKADVLIYELEGSAWLAIRPSGTEPKIKLYVGVKGTSKEEAEQLANEMAEAGKGILK